MIPVVYDTEIEGIPVRVVQYSTTLVQMFPKPFWRWLLERLKPVLDAMDSDEERHAEIVLPLWSAYRRKGGYSLFSVLGPLKISSEIEVDSLYAGFYKVVASSSTTKFGNVEVMVRSLVAEKADHKGFSAPLSELPQAKVQVTKCIGAPEVLEYVSINGKTYEVIHLVGACIGRVVSGAKLASDIAVLVPTDYKPEMGEVVDARLVYAKSGRADFLQSKYSHQINFFVPES